MCSRLQARARPRVKTPLTLAIIRALIVTCARDRYAIPQVSLLVFVRLEADQGHTGIDLVHGVPVCDPTGGWPAVRPDGGLDQ